MTGEDLSGLAAEVELLRAELVYTIKEMNKSAKGTAERANKEKEFIEIYKKQGEAQRKYTKALDTTKIEDSLSEFAKSTGLASKSSGELKDALQHILKLEGTQGTVIDAETKALKTRILAHMALTNSFNLIGKAAQIGIDYWIKTTIIQADMAQQIMQTFVGGVLEGTDAIGTMTAVMNDQVEKQRLLAQESLNMKGKFADLVAGVGMAATAFTVMAGPVGWIIRGLGLLAAGVAMYVKTQNEFDKAAVDRDARAEAFYNTQMSNFSKRFQDTYAKITSMGAVFVDGMTGMKNAANEAGVPLAIFAKGVESSADLLVTFGGSVSSGIKQLATTMKTIGEIRQKELMNLGMTTEEIMAGAAGYLESIQMAGKASQLTEKEKADGTVAYVKNLKALSDLTGQDVKSMQKKARDANLQMAVAGYTAGDAQKTAMMKQMSMTFAESPEILKILQQKTVMGTVTGEGAIAMSQNQGLREAVDAIAELSKSQEDPTKAGQRMLEIMRKSLSEYGQGDLKRTQVFGAANMVNGGFSGLQAFSSEMQKLILTANTPAKVAEVAGASARVEAAAKTTDALTTKMTELNKQFQNTTMDLETKLLPNLTTFVQKSLDLLKQNMTAMDAWLARVYGAAKPAPTESRVLTQAEQKQQWADAGGGNTGGGAATGNPNITRYGRKARGEINASEAKLHNKDDTPSTTSATKPATAAPANTATPPATRDSMDLWSQMRDKLFDIDARIKSGNDLLSKVVSHTS